MSGLILYPTETVYGLGVDVFDPVALKRLYELKGRNAAKASSWLVKDIKEIERYAHVDESARRIAERFLPGPLTLILKVKDDVPSEMLGFRISSDQHAQALAEESEHPLTATSANPSGEPTLQTPKEILAQFGKKADMISRVIDDGPRHGEPSTVVRVVGGKCEIIRVGAIPAQEIQSVFMQAG